jgi:hypothetical protein
MTLLDMVSVSGGPYIPAMKGPCMNLCLCGCPHALHVGVLCLNTLDCLCPGYAEAAITSHLPPWRRRAQNGAALLVVLPGQFLLFRGQSRPEAAQTLRLLRRLKAASQTSGPVKQAARHGLEN